MFEDFAESPLVRTYDFYASILVVKVMVMALLTIFKRLQYKAHVNPEDAVFVNSKLRINDNVERVRRAHLNDLENITLFFVSAFVYILTNPSVAWATTLFKIYTISRIIHTLVYAVVVVPQPARGLSWAISYLITGYMAVQSILYFTQ